MIVKMRKYSFLVHHLQYSDFLEQMRQLGVLHVIEKNAAVSENEELASRMQLSSRISLVLKRLHLLIQEENPAEFQKDVDALGLLEQAEGLFEKLEKEHLHLQHLEKEREKTEVWGKFIPDHIAKLKDADFQLRFFQTNLRKYDQEWEVKYNLFEIDTIGALRYFVILSTPGEEFDIDADEMSFSGKTIEDVDAEIARTKAKIEEIRKERHAFALENISSIQYYRTSIEAEMDLQKVVLNTDSIAEESVKILEGWCPVDNESDLLSYLESEKLYYESAEPTEEDAVPVKLKNNKFTKMYEAIGELYDLPNYHELDLTPFFAPFYLLFFGLCLGDAAYGLILVVAALLMRRKAKPAMRAILNLAIWLGSSTVLMGIVSSTFFGFSLLQLDWAILEPLKKFHLLGKEFSLLLDSKQLFNASLVLGGVQIVFGMIVKAVGLVRRFGWSASISTWGWLILILGMGGTYAAGALNPQIDSEILKYSNYGFLGLGGLFIFVLNDIKRNPLINIGAGVWDAYGMITGVLGDLLSYIRLFALGISGSVMGFVFNSLALNLIADVNVVNEHLSISVTNTNVINIFFMVLILLVGHSINIFMAGLGAFVHPMRLTFVEFYKNAGFQGGGKKYKPFKIIE